VRQLIVSSPRPGGPVLGVVSLFVSPTCWHDLASKRSVIREPKSLRNKYRGLARSIFQEVQSSQLAREALATKGLTTVLVTEVSARLNFKRFNRALA
jgi:hypothetical protein